MSKIIKSIKFGWINMGFNTNFCPDFYLSASYLTDAVEDLLKMCIDYKVTKTSYIIL